MPKGQPIRVLIVDDQPLITLFIREVAQQEGVEVIATCYDSECALKTILEHKPDLIFMDINIKGSLDGISVIKKAVTYDPMIYYISAYKEADIIKEALHTKAYNYLVKPLQEHDIRIALALCKKQHTQPISTLYLHENIIFNTKDRSLHYKQAPVELSKNEQMIIELLIEHLNQSIALQTIKAHVWNNKEVSDSTVRDTIFTLRKKLPELPLETLYAEGYVLKRYNNLKVVV